MLWGANMSLESTRDLNCVKQRLQGGEEPGEYGKA